ncbi:AGR305Wp [Eremothecium gossypii ATCC 10895]|uniref:Pseudouridine synthase n=1 Tax=Eremothecium gossypii (strain ATCC 10895 / CBS 109.51 / FGSC 9923 / NRRL Y-1056) TaxID=284811 RepID=Q74Z98_EREGS|nr:AGR305Wp [Eremothecium gossypii ATCC 10895]AAS54795.1 AGR305Wp [Eremothecium gossypii ATCC 10895]AEY99127.1 FAGR305Wp [Eremothecium gossypii FDAG1]
MEPYVQNGLRKLAPYWNTRSSFVKGRWYGRTLAQVLMEEFHFSSEQVQAKILAGHCQLLRDGVVLNANTELIKNKDVFQSKQHNHEPPVLQWPLLHNVAHNTAGLKVVFEDNDLLVIDKPCGIPIHPTAYFYKNTLTEVLEDARGYPLFPCYRLDKITSGLLIFAKTQQTASRLQSQIRDQNMNKWYLARVDGNFDFNKKTASSPIYTFEPKKSLKGAFAPVRDALTEFYHVAYNEELNQSLVLCKPLTGRTHQIRIHLARLGHPIVNDPFYNVKNSKYPKRSAFMLEVEDWNTIEQDKLSHLFDEFIVEIDENWRGLNPAGDLCEECGEELPRDPEKHELILYLHAWKYNGSDISFTTEYPEWASAFEFGEIDIGRPDIY